LIDEFGYWDKVKEIIRSEKKVKAADIISLAKFSPDQEPMTIFSPFNRIAVIEIDGNINSGKNATNFLFGGKSTGAEDINKFVDEINKDTSIKGVIIRINSPGGSLLASDKIYYAIDKLKKKGKVVYTSMGNLAASGGYYIAMNSDKLIANPGTLTGSIGVISTFHNFEELNNMLGIDLEVMKTGKYMNMFSVNKQLTEEEKEMLKKYQDKHYQIFVDKLKENRELSDEEVNDIAQGQIITGEQALDYKMIDDLGNFFDVVAALSRKIKISEPELVFYKSKADMPSFSRNNFFSQIFNYN
jgi:protease IV